MKKLQGAVIAFIILCLVGALTILASIGSILLIPLIAGIAIYAIVMMEIESKKED